MATVNGARLIEDLQALREFGSHPPGVVRPAFSEADMAARHWLAERFTAAGITMARMEASWNAPDGMRCHCSGQ